VYAYWSVCDAHAQLSSSAGTPLVYARRAPRDAGGIGYPGGLGAQLPFMVRARTCDVISFEFSLFVCR
jgi:hypothetical protein